MASKNSGSESILIDLVRINQIVLEFQAAWAEHPDQPIEPFLARIPEPLREAARLHLEQAADELRARPDRLDSQPEGTIVPPAGCPPHEAAQRPADPQPRGQRNEKPVPQAPAAYATETHPHAGKDPQVTTEFDAAAARNPLANPPAGGDRPRNQDERPVLDGFEIECQLGQGAYGVVYRARDTRLDREVAIKIPLLRDSSSREAYVREARNAARIEHPGIVPIYHVGLTDEGYPFVVQKFIDGSDLRDLLKRFGTLSVAHALTLISDVAEALGAAHQQGLIHRDLKPENILIDRKGFPWIADFGLAITDEEQAGRRGELAGTPVYMAPEQVLGKVDWMDGRTDLWALGIILYELLTGRPPFEAKTYRELAEEIQHRDPRPICQRNEHVPLEVESIFRRCCAKQPSDRYASTAELVQEIARVLSSVELHESELGPVTGGFYHPPTAGSSHISSGRHLASRTPTRRSSSPRRTGLGHSGRTESAAYRPAKDGHKLAWAMLLLPLLVLGVFGAGSLGMMAYQLWRGPDDPHGADGRNRVVNGGEQSDDRDRASHDVTQGNLAVGGDERSERPREEDGISTASNDTESEIESGTQSSTESDAQSGIEAELESDVVEIEPNVPRPGEPWIVDQSGNGHAETIAEAIAAAEPGATIEIRPGNYRESLTIAQDVTLVGSGGIRHVSWTNADGPVIAVSGSHRVALENLFIRAELDGAGEKCNAIELLAGGQLHIADCDFSSSCFNCVKAASQAEIRATNTTFRAEQSAISASGCQPFMFQDCTFSNSAAGLELIGTDATLDSCEFVGCRKWAMSIDDGASVALLGECLVEDSGAGLFLLSGTCRIAPHVRNATSTTFRGGTSGVRVGLGGTLEAEGCRFQRQKNHGIYVAKDALPENRLAEAGRRSPRPATEDTVLATKCVFDDCSKAIEMHHGSARLIECSVYQCFFGIVVNDAELALTGGTLSGLSQEQTAAYVPRLVDDAADNTGAAILLIRGKADLDRVAIRHHRFGIIVNPSKSDGQAPAPAKLVATGVRVENYREYAFGFTDGAEGELERCSSTSPVQSAKPLVKAAGANVTEKNCDLQ